MSCLLIVYNYFCVFRDYYLINCYFVILVFLETILRLTNTSPITLSDTCAFILILRVVSEIWVVEFYRQG